MARSSRHQHGKASEFASSAVHVRLEWLPRVRLTCGWSCWTGSGAGAHGYRDQAIWVLTVREIAPCQIPARP
jgi:hypothetical protein